jgi:DNA-binding transcriptional LysR family regulator
MQWDDLKYFLAVARYGSLRKAARDLKTSAATVGRRIADLESTLGAHLFDRNQAGYMLTESGEAIYRKAEEVEEDVLAVERAALGRDLRPTGKIRLATIDDIAALIIAPRLAQFHRDFPGISLELVAQQGLSSLTRREADVALRTVRPDHGDYVIRQVGWWSLGLYAAKSYVETHGLRRGINDLSQVDIITWTDECAHLRGSSWFAKHAPHSPIALATNSRRIQHAACKAGMGAAILPAWIADRDPNLVCLLPPAKVMTVQLWLATHRDLLRTARVRAVAGFLADLCKEMVGT